MSAKGFCIALLACADKQAVRMALTPSKRLAQIGLNLYRPIFLFSSLYLSCLRDGELKELIKMK